MSKNDAGTLRGSDRAAEASDDQEPVFRASCTDCEWSDSWLDLDTALREAREHEQETNHAVEGEGR